ncbi:type ISP restriction/modification enzyme [uncultured Tessaracoccus sp.]|uniref:type ISP restriction/modification enzyme n=1 Tax=uncultured Tessaracoccus sp. TaxID=905023 RepID=UPI0026127142|nr:type ISP restriction/modification enzyme [uncultured Tessaracoccus sp.]
MTTTVQEIIAGFADAPSQSEKGTKFERLMIDYFKHDPTLAAQYDEVMQWTEWPHRGASIDVGIDLVARSKETGDWTAIQCKFYDPHRTLQKAHIDSFFTASGKRWDGVGFTNRIIISTTDRWSSLAEEALKEQTIPVQRLGLAEIALSPIDWAFADETKLIVDLKPRTKFGLRPHQRTAIEKISEGFEKQDRGQWISACGTGKTFTSLKLAEEMAERNGGSLRVLFLAPSISLVSQSLREWTAQATTDLRPFVVCSDTKASRAAEDIAPHDVPLPATTDPQTLRDRLIAGKRAAGITVVFSTYQSLAVVAEAQALGVPEFDLILCDEAHRTTGVTLSGEDESHFVRVHDQQFIRGKKRLYMTATPRMFGDAVKTKAADHSAELTSMDDLALFGPVFHRLGFGEAVENGLLTDYKVAVLMVTEEQMAGPVQSMMADDNLEIPLDDAAKIMGAWNTLAKRTHPGDAAPAFSPGETPMKRAVAFLPNIKSSKRVADAFEDVVRASRHDADEILMTQARHVDGTMNAMVRADELAWLKAPVPDGECRILTNARCLSEGVDVPALDAVMFLSPRNSAVDVVQSVGRVMRKAPGKDFGYIILPIAVPVGVEPSEALKDNKRFKVVWDVLNALRAHDDRFEAIVQSIQLNGGKDDSGKVIVDAPDLTGGDAENPDKPGAAVQLPLFHLADWRDAIYSRIVDKVGTREYWDQWARDVARMSAAQIARIEALLEDAPDEVQAQFDTFLAGLQANLNDSITRDDAVSMLSQHLITAPVFEALFSESDFASRNPVSVGMQAMLDTLEGQGLDAETQKLDRFYESVRVRAAAVTSAAGRQQVIHDLYEKFFKNAFPRQAEALGIVYTPVEVVDFILRAADDLSRQHFGQGLTDEGVTILDPFTGTGTFMVRLLQSGIIRPEDLGRKYAQELMANEIMLLAYYVACVNIEATFEALHGGDEYVPFPGATMTDTFQISEEGDRVDTSLLPANNERITKQLATDITVIVGNPPYSVGQTNANDNNQNVKYPTLDGRIADTYAARSSAQNKNSLYDSYIRAYRWATDRLGERGIVAFVSNGGWIDGNTADGMRLAMAEEFSELWVFNLRGNQRTAGEQSRKEGGKIFGSGSRATVAVVLGVKDPAHDGPAVIHYRDIGDYLSRDEKLAIINSAQLGDDEWAEITPNAEGDWLNQRDELFQQFMPISEVFQTYSRGVETTRDAWCYNFDTAQVEFNMRRMIETFNAQAAERTPQTEQLDDSTKISWSRNLRKRAAQGRTEAFHPGSIRDSLYRPFTRQALYFDAVFNSVPGQNAGFFPTNATPNVGFLVGEPSLRTPPSVMATALLPDSKTYVDAAQFFARYTYEPGPKRGEAETLFDESMELVDGYRRIDNITDEALAHFQQAFGPSVTKDLIFTYVYGVLHSAQYRERFAADLKKMLPRIPLAKDLADFQAFADAGQRLMDLHIGYETVEPYPLQEQTKAAMDMDEWELYAVGDKRMKFPKRKGETDRTTLIYNAHVTLSGLPEEAFRYQLGSRSALEWIVDRYYIRTDKASGIVNDPNAWSREVGDPRYIRDLVGRVITVSLETMRIVDALPHLPLDGAESVEESPADVELEHSAPHEPDEDSPLPVAPELPEDPDADEWLDYFQALPEEWKTERRDRLMVEGLRAGLTLQTVGDLYGVSRERVRQIAGSQGVNIRQLREEAKQQQDRRRRRVERHIYAASLTHPELTIEELAEWAESDEATVRKALGHRRAVHEVAYNDWSGGVTDEELIDGLQRWAEESSVHTGDSFTEWALEHGLPSKQIPTMRFGGWNNALRRAGLHHLVLDRGGPRPTMPDEVLWAAVLQFFRDDVERYTYQGYEQYWKSRGLPSTSTIRARLGSWSDVKARVRQLMRYAVAPDGTWGWGEAVLAVHPEQYPRNVVSKETALEALREVAARTTGPLTVALYEEHRDPTHPNAAMVQSRCGLWINALHEAGLEDRMSTRARRHWYAREDSTDREES